ncbi:DUF6759 domain-containing protein [Chitinophaga silvisoli]|uniref:DUF6759 domain-containing protein n=1 Tax=Chitinophaga silvisoli TaxID=2291814 RepID=A0A3E1NY01_9BACT|nr:DUF6759 domain-containing protein [Chitinophaga silvisoli]RFM32785.1 hypothetical protein DXN04_24270 [Chitinophaga silvisoli]
MKKISLIFIFTILYSCVPQSEYDKVVSQKNEIEQERDKLMEELEGIKFGAPNLLSDGKTFYYARFFINARMKFQTLVEKYPDMPLAIEAKKYLSDIDEEELWSQANTLEDISYCEKYISKYPNGHYITMAISRRAELAILDKQKLFDAATAQNTSYSWRNFLDRYPDYPDAEAIRKKIIRLEVDEIFGDKATGQMPTFNQYNNNYSANSSVQISNNTGCELTVRYYSGPEAELIIIPVGANKTVYLPSGSYKIAASACGANYAGNESLHGEYGSTFYITSSKY